MWEMWQKKKSSQGGSDRRTRCWPMSNQWRLSNLVTKNFFPDPIILYLSSPSSTTGPGNSATRCTIINEIIMNINYIRISDSNNFHTQPNIYFGGPLTVITQLGPFTVISRLPTHATYLWNRASWWFWDLSCDMCVLFRYSAAATKDWLSLLGVSKYHSARLAHFSEVSKFHLN